MSVAKPFFKPHQKKAQDMKAYMSYLIAVKKLHKFIEGLAGTGQKTIFSCDDYKEANF